jgi:hypothetical protein
MLSSALDKSELRAAGWRVIVVSPTWYAVARGFGDASFNRVTSSVCFERLSGAAAEGVYFYSAEAAWLAAWSAYLAEGV